MGRIMIGKWDKRVVEANDRYGKGELVTSPVYRPRQRSPLSHGYIFHDGDCLASTGTTDLMTAKSAVPAVSAASGSTTATTPETTMQNRGPMLTNQDDAEEKLKRTNEMFMRSLEGMGKVGSVRRRDKEKEKEVGRDTATRRGLFLVSPSEGEVPANPSSGGGGPLMHTSASPCPGQQYPNHPTRIPSPTSSAG